MTDAWQSEVAAGTVNWFFRVSVWVSVCVQAGFGGCVFVCLWMCALPLWPLSCFGVRSLRHLIMERVVAGNHNRNKPLRGGIFIGAKKKKKSCFQENKRSGRGLVLIGSGVWGKWGEKRIISSWEMVKFYREFLGEVPTIRDAENPVPVIESSSTEMRCLSSLTESRYGTDTTGIWTLHLKWFYLLTLRDSLYKVHTKPSWTILHFSGDFRHSKPLMLFEPLYCSFSFFFFFGVKSVDNKKSLRLQCSSSKCLYMGWYRLFVGPTLSVQA